MVPNSSSQTDAPKLSFHKGSGQGVVRLHGRDVYCGKFGTEECQAKYHSKVAEWLNNGRRLPAAGSQKPTDRAEKCAPTDITVNDPGFERRILISQTPSTIA